MEQRRASIRLRTLLEGRILLGSRVSPVECTVRDISEKGARITFVKPVPLPPEFELQVPKRKISRQVRVVWSNEKSHGLMFVEEQEAGGPMEASAGVKPAAPESPEIPAILAEARARIAQHLGIPVDAVRLKAEIDY
jgi:PilZ domain-containing protein